MECGLSWTACSATQATAAVGVVFPVMTFIQATGFFCGQGSGTFVSRRLGAGDIKEANEMAATGFMLAIIMGALLSLIGFVFMNPLARLLGASDTLLNDTVHYMRIILCGAPYMTAQLVINNQLRFQGSAVYAMAGLVSGAILNIGLDPLLIFVFKMGVSGAALATVISQCVAFTILFIGSRKGANIRLKFSNIRFNRKYLLAILNGGSPSLARQGLASISAILLNTAAGRLGGDAGIAGMAVVTRIMMLLISSLIGFGQGYQPVCSFNYGAKKYDRVREGFFFCFKVGTVLLTVIAIVIEIFAPQVVAFFRDDPEVVKVGISALRWQAAALPLTAFTVVSNMMLQSMGKGLQASITASARNGICFIPLILILPRLFGMTGVEMTQAMADVLSLFIALPLALRELRIMKEESLRMKAGEGPAGAE